MPQAQSTASSPRKKIFESPDEFELRLDRWKLRRARKNVAWRKMFRQELRDEGGDTAAWKSMKNTLRGHDDGMRHMMALQENLRDRE